MHRALIQRRPAAARLPRRRQAKRILAATMSLAYVGATAIVARVTRLIGREWRFSVVVLTYHELLEDQVPRFRRHMRWLSRRCAAVFADDLSRRSPRACVAITFDDAFESVFDRALPILAEYGIPATVFVPTGYLGQAPTWVAEGHPRRSRERVVSADALVSTDGRAVLIGSHTVSHPRLADVEPERLVDELVSSRAHLQRLTGKTIDTLALPYGSWSPAVAYAARAAGYRLVFGNVPVNTTRSHGIVGRVDASASDSWLELYLKCRGGYGWMAVAVPIKRALRELAGPGKPATE